MMDILIFATVGLSVYIACNLIITVVRRYNVYKFFELKKTNIPIILKPTLLGDHMINFSLNKRNWQYLENLHKIHKTKIGATFYLDNPFISTLDIDLIKKIAIDEGEHHINRIELKLLVEEWEIGSIAFARDNQWLRLRKAVAPALS